MLIDKKASRPTTFTFMMIDQWSNQTAYDTWDVRNVYSPNFINQDYQKYIKWLDIRKKIFYSERPYILMASYSLGLQQDYKLFNQTFSYFHHVARLDRDVVAIDYLRALNNQLTGSLERTKTLNKYFIHDTNLLIIELNALNLVIKRENLTHIVVMGEAWEACLKNRPVGLKYVDRSISNYYIIPQLCYKFNGESMTEQDLIDCTETRWARCEDFTDLEFEQIKRDPGMANREIIPMYKLVEILK